MPDSITLDPTKKAARRSCVACKAIQQVADCFDNVVLVFKPSVHELTTLSIHCLFPTTMESRRSINEVGHRPS